MTPLKTILRAFIELGPKPMVLYGMYQVLLRLGFLRRRTAAYTWQERPLAWWLCPGMSSDADGYLELRNRSDRRFFIEIDDAFRNSLKQSIGQNVSAVIAEADPILAGKFRLFGSTECELGFPPDWSTFATMPGEHASGSVVPDRHWTAYSEHDLEADIKLLWEPARLGWAFPLARAFVLTDENQYADAIWTLINSWREVNPPNLGLHWYSAQEVAIRLLAMVFVFFTTFRRLAESPRRLCELAQMIAAQAARIPPTLLYARAQANNHLLVEAVALYTAGMLFPEFRKANSWKRLGRQWLEHSINHQFFTDGGYVQHSSNYHRLALQASLWAARLAEANGEPFSSKTLDTLGRATRWLDAMIDRQSGWPPNIGPNDGALIFPLSSADFEDHRSTCQAASRAFLGQACFEEGPWDEESIWFGLIPKEDEVTKTAGRRTVGDVTGASFGGRSAFAESGFYLICGEQAWGLLRCAKFRSRPGHSDQLHFDLWWRGHNLACDPGTYLYNGKPPWENPWTGAAAHNTLVVDAEEPMRRAGRFLWLDWAQGRLVGHWRSPKGDLEVLIGEHSGYQRSDVLQRRTVVKMGDDLWLVVDDLLGSGEHDAVIGWTLPERPWKMDNGNLSIDLGEAVLELHCEGQAADLGLYKAGKLIDGNEVVRNPEIVGWRSTKYAVKEPALRLVQRDEAALPARYCTWWAFAGADKAELEIDWVDPGHFLAPFSWLKWRGEQLEINDAHSVDTSGLRRTR